MNILKYFLIILTVFIFVWCDFNQNWNSWENENNNNSQEENNFSQSGSFSKNEDWNYTGELKIKWFAESTQKKEAFCEENCENFTYLFFNILDSNDQDLDNFLSENNWSYFVEEDRIWIGCKTEENTINYYNESDENWLQEYELNSELSQKIINSSKNSPVTLSLNMPLLSMWSGAPTCYSYFEIIQE